jgi:hypothetical protein
MKMITQRLYEQEFRKKDFNPEVFFQISRRFLEGNSVTPVLVADSCPKFEYDYKSVRVYFHKDVLKEILENKTKFQRDLYSVLTYGFIGPSRGGKNGLVLVNSSRRDSNFVDVPQRFRDSRYSGFCESIGFNQNSDKIVGVKLVTHRKNGERIVGVLDRNDWRAVLYGIRRYSR